MNPGYKAEIKQRAAEIRERLSKGLFYGEPIDMSDPDLVLVAACAMIQTEADAAHAGYIAITRSLLTWERDALR